MRLSTHLALPCAAVALASGITGAMAVAGSGTEARRASGAPPVLTPAVAIPQEEAGVGRRASTAERRTVTVPVHAADHWIWPLVPRPRVMRPFSSPQGRYGPGHRGLDLLGSAGALVHAVAAGTVMHVGVVAGRGTVTVLHASGLRSTYEPVSGSVTRGQVVDRGTALGRLVSSGSHCGGVACLHLGAIRGTEYVDPLPLLEGGRVRLLPLR